ncbi:MAG: Lrp/AsnC family transcriptional regulator [Paramuribaculum sp.]|nr:Lrp/AsnC family transcriptional regulator [Bacteroides sp.]MDE7460194.1 Lrp/AsnC family transcriptional regulator [Paramuribaculum sp.]
MGRQQFDALDCKIIRMLSQNARTPFLEIARECGVSGAAIHQRIQKLTSSGVINGFESLISPEALGYETCAYIGFFLHDPSQFDSVVAELKKIPEVVECHMTTGKYDLLVKLYARNNSHLLEIIHGRLQSIGSGRTETLISFKEEFRRQVPIDETAL